MQKGRAARAESWVCIEQSRFRWVKRTEAQANEIQTGPPDFRIAFSM